MITLIMLIRKREELSREEFITYYTQKHLALIGRLFEGALPDAARYRFVAQDNTLLKRLVESRGETVLDEGVTAISELSFDTAADAEAMVERMLAPAILPSVLADESNFIAPNGITWFMAAE